MIRTTLIPRTDGGIDITVTGTHQEPLRETQRLVTARGMATKHFGSQAHQLFSGGSFGPEGWTMFWSFYPQGYLFPRDDRQA